MLFIILRAPYCIAHNGDDIRTMHSYWTRESAHIVFVLKARRIAIKETTRRVISVNGRKCTSALARSSLSRCAERYVPSLSVWRNIFLTRTIFRDARAESSRHRGHEASLTSYVSAHRQKIRKETRPRNVKTYIIDRSVQGSEDLL